ncbi:MAG: signal peptidase I [Nanoarchaeota archaeon]|nr:signal peptidase I [Nanoarchaeota archaeon]
MTFKKGLKNLWKKFWFLLWKDDSFKGWIFSIIFLFVFIKFIFFPGLSLVTGTSLPLAIVESCSMYHKGNLLSDFGSWWQRHDDKYSEFTINELDFQDFPMNNGFNKGDILFIIRANPEKLEEGDIIIFNANQRNPVIHRIVDIRETNDGKIFSTIGDNNNGQLAFEERITEDMLVGKAVARIAPYFGWVKLVFYDWQKPVSERGFCDEN